MRYSLNTVQCHLSLSRVLKHACMNEDLARLRPACLEDAPSHLKRSSSKHGNKNKQHWGSSRLTVA
jgi:hypothetical protein